MKTPLALPPFLATLVLMSAANAAEVNINTATNQPIPIPVEVGVGHTLDFSQTDQRVFKGWIGDGGRCLMLSPGSPLEQGASIIHLRRISPCQEVEGLPEVSETILTLVTLDAARKTTIYQFLIDYSATGDSLTSLVPGESIAQQQSPAPEVRQSSLDPAAVQAGLASFDLPDDSPVTARVAAWLSAVEAGQGHRLAAQAASLDWSLLERLEAVGSNSAVVEGAIEL